MTEPRVEIQVASDGYPLHTLVWPAVGDVRGQVIVLHGVQSHGGWYHGLGRILSSAGFEAHFPDRRGSGANQRERGHAPSAKRLILDITERLEALRKIGPGVPTTLAGISWGGKLAVITAAEAPELVDGVALICPGLHPRVGVSSIEKLQIALAFLTNRFRTFPIPLSDPALFTANPDAQAFIASDPLGLRRGTAGLLATSSFIDRRVRRARDKVKHPVLLMLAGQDRIVNNERTLAYVRGLASPQIDVIEYPEAHHTLEFEPEPGRYSHDLVNWLTRIPQLSMNLAERKVV